MVDLESSSFAVGNDFEEFAIRILLFLLAKACVDNVSALWSGSPGGFIKLCRV
jgi:hypothetical protein